MLVDTNVEPNAFLNNTRYGDVWPAKPPPALYVREKILLKRFNVVVGVKIAVDALVAILTKLGLAVIVGIIYLILRID
jgi:hypothetical protein